jgi:hypothetical protein
MKARFSVCLCALVMLLLVATPAAGHPFTTYYTSRWYPWHHDTGLNIHWRFSPGFPEGKKRERVKESFGKWEELGGSLRFNQDPESEGLTRQCGEDPQPSGIIFTDNLGAGIKAETQVCVHGAQTEGYIGHRFYIAFDETRNWHSEYNEGDIGPFEWDFKSTAVHEAGHATAWGGLPVDQSHYDSINSSECNQPPIHTMCSGAFIHEGDTFWRSLEEHDRHTFNATY